MLYKYGKRMHDNSSTQACQVRDDHNQLEHPFDYLSVS